MNIACLFVCILVSYLIGAIPNALIIGKVFFHKDIREYGSHNLGGTNAGRVLGPIPGVITIALDMLKMVVAILISYFICYLFKIENSNFIYVSGIFAAIGHCYPIYCGFRGGKAVSVIVGFLLVTNPLLVLVFALFFFSILYLKKMVSLASMLSSVFTGLIMFIPFWSKTMIPLFTYNIYYPITFLILSLLLIIRHSSNIKRIINKTESKIKWMG